MRLQKNNSGFTLIELIVVITILAILGTIAFISLQGYSWQARDSARISNLGDINREISVGSAQWASAFSYIKDDTSFVGWLSLAWRAAMANNTTNPSATWEAYEWLYKAGKLNYVTLGIKEDDFTDPKTDDAYLVGATNLWGPRFQIAATLEKEWGVAYVLGNYNSRGTTAYDVTWTDWEKKATLKDSGYGFFKVWDTTDLWKILGISDDKTKITLDTVVASFTTETIALNVAEVNSLVWDPNDTTNHAAIVHGGTTLPYPLDK